MHTIKTKYFGPPQHRKQDEAQVDTPVGQRCILCDETVVDGDIGTISSSSQIAHYECQLRSVIGSVLHQQGLCTCLGGGIEEDENISYRQSARQAAAYWARNHTAK